MLRKEKIGIVVKAHGATHLVQHGSRGVYHDGRPLLAKPKAATAFACGLVCRAARWFTRTRQRHSNLSQASAERAGSEWKNG